MEASTLLKAPGAWLAWVVMDAVTAAGKEVVYDYETKVRTMARKAEEDDEAGR